MNQSLFVLAMALLLTDHGLCCSNESAYEKGMALIKSQGAEAGIEFFESHSLATGELSSLFGMAWAYWKDDQAGDAELLCHFILRERSSEAVRAHCHYLLGYLLMQKTEYLEARAHLLKALPVYERKQWADDIFNTTCGLAAASIFAQDLAAAETYLARARQDMLFIKENLGFFYDLEARLAFAKGDYAQALVACDRGYQAYSASGDQIHMAVALSSAAFFSILSGDMEGGHRRANEAKAIYERHHYTILSYYNLVNLILIYRCHGQTHKEAEAKVRQWTKDHEDRFLDELLNFALAWDCRGLAPR